MKALDHLIQLQAQLYRETRSQPKPLGRLMPWLLDRRNLEAAWQRVQQSDGANTPGPDGLTCSDLQRRAQSWLGELADDLLHDRYHADAPRLIDVPKKPGSSATRRLGILTVRDRIVHGALKQVLEPVLEPMFQTTSFGFRPGRSVAAALHAATKLCAQGRPMNGVPRSAPAGPSPLTPRPSFLLAAHLDIRDCFPTIDHQTLHTSLAQIIADEALLRLIAELLEVSGTTAGWWRRRRVGLLQGSALSPLLCNLYLHPLDVALSELGESTQQGVACLRYADDLLLLARDQRSARLALKTIKGTLRSLHQRLRSEAAPQPLAEGVDWLGVRLQPRTHAFGRPRFGYIIPSTKVVDMLARLDEMTVPPSSRIDPTAFDLGRWIVSINDQLRDWYQAYVYADNVHDVFRAIDEHALERLAELLHSVTGLRRNDLYKQYRLWLPRGFWTWHVGGNRLILLSARAPRRPRLLTRQPLWMRCPKKQSAKTTSVAYQRLHPPALPVAANGSSVPPDL